VARTLLSAINAVTAQQDVLIRIILIILSARL